jgi:hypothetical protein
VLRRGVAVQVEFGKPRLETRISLYRLQGLKPGAFKLWVTTGFNLYSRPHHGGEQHVVAVQVEFESKGLKPDFSLHRFKG